MELTPNLHAFLWTSPRANNCNTYLIRTEEKNILIDPGHEAYFDHVRRGLSPLGLSVEDIDLVICTHAHPDHIEAVRLLDRDRTPFALHEAEWRLIQEVSPHLKPSMDLAPFAPDFFLAEGELEAGDVTLEVFHTPGHSPGGVTLYWPAERALITGDLIFKGALGRTDLPGGNGSQLKESIRRMAGIDAGRLLPGHGEGIAGSEGVKENFGQVEKFWFRYI